MDVHDVLPFPKTRDGWLVGILLSISMFLVYYFLPSPLFHQLENAYLEHFWQGEPKEIQGTELEIEIRVPRYVSSFVEREIVMSIRNLTDSSISAGIIVSIEDALAIVRADTEIAASTYSGSSTVPFGIIPPKGTITRGLWFQPLIAEQESIHLAFYLQTGADVKSLTNGRTSIAVSSEKTLVQSFIRVLLLPPWLNLFLPITALILTWFREEFIQDLEREGGTLTKKKRLWLWVEGILCSILGQYCMVYLAVWRLAGDGKWIIVSIILIALFFINTGTIAPIRFWRR